MGPYDYLDVNDAKIEALWHKYLRARGLRSDADPIPSGETSEEFRRRWEKFLYAQAPSGAAASAATGAGASLDSSGGVITDVPKAPVKVQPGELPGDVDEQAALKAGAVLLYEHKDFGGRVFALPVGRYGWIEDAGIPNDLISSVKVPSGYTLTLFEHKDFGGKARKVTGNVSFLSDFNDMASAAKVERG